MKFYGEKFREARIKSRWTTVALAKECCVSRHSVILWEKGKVAPREQRVKELASLLNVNVSAISDLEDNIPVSGNDLSPVLTLWNNLAASCGKTRQDRF